MRAFVGLIGIVCLAGTAAADIVVVEKGRTQAEIIAPAGEKAAPAEVHAGRELQHWIGRITGAYVPLLASEKEGDAELKVKLHVGCAA